MKKLNVFLAAVALVMSTLSVNAEEQTTVSQDATCGQTVKLVATPQPGYKFVQWSNGSTNDTLYVEISSTLDVYNYTATFAPDTYALTVGVNNAEMGSVTGAGDYEFGAQVEIVATPSSKCYRFVRWADEDPEAETVGATRTVTVGATAAENTYEAIFEQVTFTVNAKSDNVSFGTVTISMVE